MESKLEVKKSENKFITSIPKLITLDIMRMTEIIDDIKHDQRLHYFEGNITGDNIYMDIYYKDNDQRGTFSLNYLTKSIFDMPKNNPSIESNIIFTSYNVTNVKTGTSEYFMTKTSILSDELFVVEMRSRYRYVKMEKIESKTYNENIRKLLKTITGELYNNIHVNMHKNKKYSDIIITTSQ